MLNKSRQKGITGAGLMLIAAFLLLSLGIPMANTAMPDPYSDEEPVHFESIGIYRTMGDWVTKVGWVFLISAVLGIVGVSLIDRRNNLAAAFMIIAGIISLITVVGIISCVLLISAATDVISDDKETQETKEE